jgi:hypothetical protein
MGERRIEGNITTMEQLFRTPFPWESPQGEGAMDISTAHARVVEFIAKPGENLELQKCITSSVLPFLEKQSGFKRSFVLTPHREPRLVLVFSFWEEELDARENQWESAPEIHRAVLPLVDSFSRVRTYQAMFPEVCQTKAEPALFSQAGQPC